MISAIILAAGESKRMGQPKMLLPWGEETVLSHVITVFREAGIEDILVVTGGAREKIESEISSLKVKNVFNKQFTNGEMLSSIQCGINTLTNQTQAVLIGLGDQPQVKAGSVRKVCNLYRESKSKIVVPSYKMRRGHPWLLARVLWDELLKAESPRDFLNAQHKKIQYAAVDDPAILADLDTPDDYEKWKP